MAGVEQNFLEAASLKGGESLLGLASALRVLGESLFLAFLSRSVLTLTALTARAQGGRRGIKGQNPVPFCAGIALIRLN